MSALCRDIAQASWKGKQQLTYTTHASTATNCLYQFNYSEFMECWQEAVPQGMKTDLAQLKVSEILATAKSHCFKSSSILI